MHKKIYIHYGAKKLRHIEPIRNQRFFTKPIGGLWASPIDAIFGWKQWCEREHFRKNTEDNAFKFTVKDDTKVIHIRSIKDLEKLPKLTNYDNLMCYLDFEEIQKYYDAIELHLSEEEQTIENFCNGLYFQLYGWDCDSILIFHDDAIEEI